MAARPWRFKSSFPHYLSFLLCFLPAGRRAALPAGIRADRTLRSLGCWLAALLRKLTEGVSELEPCEVKRGGKSADAVPDLSLAVREKRSSNSEPYIEKNSCCRNFGTPSTNCLEDREVPVASPVV